MLLTKRLSGEVILSVVQVRFFHVSDCTAKLLAIAYESIYSLPSLVLGKINN